MSDQLSEVGRGRKSVMRDIGIAALGGVVSFALTFVVNLGNLYLTNQSIKIASDANNRDQRRAFLEFKQKTYANFLDLVVDYEVRILPAKALAPLPVAIDDRPRFWQTYFGYLNAVYEPGDEKTVGRIADLFVSVVQASANSPCLGFVQQIVRQVARCTTRSLADAGLFSVPKNMCEPSEIDQLEKTSGCTEKHL